MLIKQLDLKYNFAFTFDDETGFYMRTGILDAEGRDTGRDPFMGSFPHLIDVGVMGHCVHGKSGLCLKAGIGCYQSGMLIEEPNMAVEDFRWLAQQCSGRVNQFALGGRGDPDMHEHFEELLQICTEHHIVPNFTTSGFGFTPEKAALCKRYCGAVAVSWYRNQYTLDAIDMLLKAGVKTNIHYVLGNNSIDEAIQRLEEDQFPAGVNAVVFLLHKPTGMGRESNVLHPGDPRVARFFHQIDRDHPFKTGMDSCTVPGALNFCSHVLFEALDTCEGGRYSCYVSPDMMMTPCSFDQQKKYAVSLRGSSVEAAWNSESFQRFRSILRRSCPDCTVREMCLGGCPLTPQIVLCQNKHEP